MVTGRYWSLTILYRDEISTPNVADWKEQMIGGCARCWLIRAARIRARVLDLAGRRIERCLWPGALPEGKTFRCKQTPFPNRAVRPRRNKR